MTKLTNEHIAHLCRQADKGYPRDSLANMATRWNVTKRRLRQILQEYQETKRVPQLNPNRRPKAKPLTPEEKKLIREAREHTRRGATKIYKHLRKQGHRIPKHKIHAYATAKKWSTPNPRKQKQRSRCRYERDHSGSLVHGDWHRTTENHPHCILWEDDASRRVLAGGEYDAESGEMSIFTFDQAVAEAAAWNVTIEAANTDRGSVFYANEQTGKKTGMSQFENHLIELGVRFIPSRRNNPQTNGKLERLWLEYDRHRWRFDTLEQFIAWYNRQIHDALWVEVYETPDEAWERKARPEALLGWFLGGVERGAA